MNRKLHLEIVTQMLTLTTSAFGIVAALAWNNVVQTFINDFVKPYVPAGSSVLVSQLIYATVITALVVVITLRLTGLKEKLSPSSP